MSGLDFIQVAQNFVFEKILISTLNRNLKVLKFATLEVFYGCDQGCEQGFDCNPESKP